MSERGDQFELSKQLKASEVIIEQMREIASGDEDFLSDLIEGETPIFELIDRIMRSEVDDQIELSGIKAHIEQMQTRRKRVEHRIETKRTLIASALSQIGVKTHRTPLGTISISPKKLSAIVLEEADIPARFWKTQAPALDKAELNKAVLARETARTEAEAIEDPEERKAALAEVDRQHPLIPGATVSNGGIVLSIRR